jgi:hypothetical protein
MSLEQALERNTEMMADLIRALEGFQPLISKPVSQQEWEWGAPPVPKSILKADTPTTSEEKPSAAIPETTSTPATTAGIEYAQVAAAITSTFKVDKAKVIAALAKFGAAKGPQLKVEDYAAFLEELAA